MLVVCAQSAVELSSCQVETQTAGIPEKKNIRADPTHTRRWTSEKKPKAPILRNLFRLCYAPLYFKGLLFLNATNTPPILVPRDKPNISNPHDASELETEYLGYRWLACLANLIECFGESGEIVVSEICTECLAVALTARFSRLSNIRQASIFLAASVVRVLPTVPLRNLPVLDDLVEWLLYCAENEPDTPTRHLSHTILIQLKAKLGAS
jgi:hypothetical protein